MGDSMAPAGRPRFGNEKRQRYTVMLEPSEAEQIRTIGKGSLTRGLRTLVALGKIYLEKKNKAKRRTTNQ